MKTAIYLLLVLLFLSSCSSPAKWQDLPFVIDSADVLTLNQKIDLSNAYVYLEAETKQKMGLLTIRNHKPDPSLPAFSRKYFNEHNMGADSTRHNILIVFCTECHGVDIITGPSPDDRITKAKMHAIIDTVMIPEFKYDRHYAGLQKGTDAIFALLDTSVHSKL